MNKLFIILFLFVTTSFSQQSQDSLSLLRKTFEVFKYSEVIILSNKLLQSREIFSIPQQIDMYRMKAISHYSLNEDNAAKNSFIEIVKLDSNYTMDQSRTSPKIISFFKDVKKEFWGSPKDKQLQVLRVDTVYVPTESPVYLSNDHLKDSYIRSLVLPGWGHLHYGSKTKGLFLTLLSSAAALSSVYFIIDTNSKENAYLNERSRTFIESKYVDYNNSYRFRNISIASFIAVWLYSQIDLFLLTPSLGVSTSSSLSPAAPLFFSISIPF